ncbi:ABC-type transport auxiliary lipoprotein family protein [Sphingomonas sp.]|uniref:ABC-type transport auxiliary lipoprotein family protein n=1 Tax=Sphingomonas sp. TaxID=28214 RepID=UPI0025D64CA1|nr:ABC-type transport auxiliary lipoprotein family protein [Sphingomonas sp.]MBV9526945.1 membrane integrity-associated transporter subunit PqiC [Sphingomonas sp.]
MKSLTRLAVAIALAAPVGGCSLGGLLGGGGKAPPALLTLTPDAPDPGAMSRTASPGQAVTITAPILPKELHTVRVPAAISPTEVQYVTNLQMIDTPDHLFQDLLSETIRRTTNRVVLDTGTTTLDPGLVVGGELRRFGYDAQSGQVVVEFDAAISTREGAQVHTRRFIAQQPADGTAPTVGPALNRAANQVAAEAAQWIGATSL